MTATYIRLATGGPVRHLTTDDDMPASARRLALAAKRAGWRVNITAATGTPLDNAGNEQRVTRWVELSGEDGKPLLTPSGKPKRERVTTDEPLVVESVAVRLHKGHGEDEVRIAAVWWDGSFSAALQQRPFRKLTSPEVVAIVTSEVAA